MCIASYVYTVVYFGYVYLCLVFVAGKILKYADDVSV